MEAQNYVRKHGCPFLIGGDHNCPPHLAREWAERHMGIARILATQEPTCKAKKPRVLDYFLVAPAIYDAIGDIALDHTLGFRPHSLVTLCFQRGRLAEQVKVLKLTESGEPMPVPGPVQVPEARWACLRAKLQKAWDKGIQPKQAQIDEWMESWEELADIEARQRFRRFERAGGEIECVSQELRQALKTRDTKKVTPSLAADLLSRLAKECAASLDAEKVPKSICHPPAQA